MDPLSISVAVLALIGTATQLKAIIDDTRHSTKEQARLLTEVNGWSILLTQWKDRLKEARAEDEWFKGLIAMAKPDGTVSPAGNFIPNGRYHPDGVFMQLQKAYDELVAELRPEHGLKKFSKKLKWFWDKKAVNEKVAEIDRLTKLISSILREDDSKRSQTHFKVSQTTNKIVDATDRKVDAIDKRLEKEERIKEQRRRQKERDAIVKWLSPLEFYVVQEDTFAKAAPIGQWLLDESEEFREWVSGPHQWALDCFGPPGVGKTVLSSIVVHHLQKRFEGQNVPVLYLYFNHKEKEIQTPVNLFGSLLKQLIGHQGSIAESAEVKRVYEKARREFRPQFGDIYEAFRSSLNSFTRAFIVVDALDECQEEIRVDLSNDLRRLLSTKVSIMVTQRAENDRIELKVAVCSICLRKPIKIYYTCWTCETDGYDICQSCKVGRKHCRDNSHELFESDRVHIDIRTPDEEIERYVTWEINKEFRPGIPVSGDPRFARPEPRNRFGRIISQYPHLRKDIPDTVVAMANGMILLARFYVTSLKLKQNLDQIEETLKSLPKEVDSNYDKIMERIDAQTHNDSSLARRLLSWIACTHRPLSLVELQHALAVKLGDTEFKSGAIVDKTLLLSITAGLVIVDADELAVRLTHFTAQEYFDKYRETHFPNAATELARVTLTYLSFKSLSEPCEGIKEDEEFFARLKVRPFLSYASQYWGMHVHEANSDSTIQAAVLQFVSNPGRLASTIQAAWYLDTTGSSSWDVRKDVNSLHVCAWFGLDATVRQLVNHGLYVDSADQTYGQTALMYACRRGHTSTVKTLLELNADVNSCSKRESTPLFEAVQEGQLEVVKLLLERKELFVNATQPRKFNRTALMLASAAGLVDIVEALLQRQDIDINLKDAEGSAALSVAADAGDALVVEFLLDMKGADGRPAVDINSVNRNGNSALTLAAKKGHDTVVWELLEGKADTAIRDGEGGGTAIFRAVDHGQIDVVQRLLQYDADVRILDNLDRSLLHSASLNGSTKILRLLINERLDVDLQDKYGRTPLHDSARAGTIDVTKVLLEVGANRSLEDCHGRTAFAVARQHGHRRIMLILEGKEDITDEEVENLGPIPDAESLPVWSLAKLGMRDLVERAIASRPAAVYENDPDSNDTALHWAVVSNHTDILSLLLSATDLSPDSLNDYLRTPLHLAALKGNLHATTTLLASPNDLNLDQQDKWGTTSLLIACACGFFPIAITLIAAGAFIDGRKIEIQPLFFAAAELGNADAVMKLIAAGADVLAKNPQGHTGLQIARENGHKEVTRVLQRKRSEYVPMRTNTERSRESGGRSQDSTPASTPGTTPGATPVVSPRPEMGARRGSFAFRPRPALGVRRGSEVARVVEELEKLEEREMVQEPEMLQEGLH